LGQSLVFEDSTMPRCLFSIHVMTFLACTALGTWPASLCAQEPPTQDKLPPGAVARLGNNNFWQGTPVQALACSPDESLIASLGDDNAICLWETATGKLQRRITWPRVAPTPNRRVTLTGQGPLLRFSGDGKVIAVMDARAFVHRFWQVASGEELSSIPLSYIQEEMELPAGVVPPPGAALPKRGVVGASALSHDGHLLALAQADKDNSIHVLAPGQKEPVRKLADRGTRVVALAFAPDGKTLASAGDDQAVYLWDLGTGKRTHALTGHRAVVQEIAFAPDGQRVLTASLDGTLRLWDTATGQPVARADWKPANLGFLDSSDIFVNRGTIPVLQSAWFDADGRRCGVFFTIVFGTSGNGEHVAVRVDSTSGKVLGRHIVHEQLTSGAALALTRRTVAIGGQARGPVVAMAPRRNLLVRTTPSQHVDLVDWTTGLPTAPGLHAGCADVEMAGDHVAIVQENDSAIYLWDWKGKAPLRQLSGHTGRPFLVGFTPRGNLLASASRDTNDRSLSVWDSARAMETRSIAGWNPGAPASAPGVFSTRAGAVPSVPSPQLSPDGKRIAFRGLDAKLHIVDLATGADVAAEDFAWKGDGCIAFTSDGKQLVISDHFEPSRGFVPAGAPKTEPSSHLHLFDAATGKKLGLINQATYEFGIARLYVAGRHAIAGCKDGAIRMLDLDTGKPVRDIWQSQARPELLPALATINRAPLFIVSADGRMLALHAPDNKSLRLLEVATGEERLTLPFGASPVTCLGFDAQALHLVTGNQDGTVLVWGLGRADDASTPETDALWQDLANTAPLAFRSLRVLLGRPADAVALANKHLKPVLLPDEAVVLQKIRDLDNANFAARQKAQEALVRMGDPIRKLVEKVAAGAEVSAETKQRLAAILKRFETSSPSGDRLRELRALELLERLGTKDAQDTLRRLASGAPGAFLTLEANAALLRLTR
jgi:WD40 repeat protein